MSVVNVKVSCIRPKYQNLKEWIEDPNNIYIGRAGIVFIEGQRYPRKSSPFANPYKINGNRDRKQVLKLYKEYIINKLNNDDELFEKFKKLKGKNLGCWCYPLKCHGDILLELLEQI